MRYLVFVFLLIAGTSRSAPVDSMQMEQWFEAALVQFDKDNVDSFDFYYQKVASALKDQNDLKGWIIKHKTLGKKALLDKNQPDESLLFLEKSFEENLFRTPEIKEEWEELGYLYIFAGYVQNNEFEDFEEARDAYRRAEQILVEQLGINDFYVARFLYLPLSTIYTMKGDYTAAETVLSKCYQVCMAEGELDYAASVLSDLSVVYLDLGAYDKAASVCQKGLSMSISDEVSLALLNSNMAKTQYFKNHLEQSLPYAQAASDYFQILIDQGWAEVAMGWLAVNKSLIGEIFTARHDFVSADLNFSAAELLLHNIYDNQFDRDFGKLYHTWGQSKLVAGDPQKALDLFQKSLQSMLPLFRAENPLQNPAVKELYGENTLMDALLGKALALDQLNRQNNDVALLESALECHDRIFEVERLLRQSYYYEDSKLYNIEESRQRCAHAIDLCLQLAAKGNGLFYRHKAFELAEKSKSVLLLEAFLQNNAVGMSLPEELQKEERNFQKAILDQEKILHQLEVNPSLDSLKIQEAREDLLSGKKLFADWKKKIRESHGQYYNNRYNDQPISVEMAQKNLLKSDETLLEYFVGDSIIYLFIVNRENFEVLEIKKPENFESDVLSFLASIQGFAVAENADQLCREYTRLGQTFYELLLKQSADAGRLKANILVVPSGILAYLPFDVLLTTLPQQECQFNQYPYALYDYNFHYGYSATLHQRLGELPSRSPGDFLAIAPEFKGKNGWGALRANVDLVKQLEDTWEGIYAINDSATIARLEKSLDNQTFEVVHFSTHAEANIGRADFSFIVFADGSGNYDSLFVKDIYQLRLLSEMVVLGACETATGSLYDGEGVISLARAFLQVGSRSVITTLWSVYDGTNQNVMLDFYANLQKGMTKSKALQKAKINQTQMDSRSAHPVFWAAYVPYGQMDAIRKSSSLWIFGMALMVLAGGILFFRRRLPFQKSH